MVKQVSGRHLLVFRKNNSNSLTVMSGLRGNTWIVILLSNVPTSTHCGHNMLANYILFRVTEHASLKLLLSATCYICKWTLWFTGNSKVLEGCAACCLFNDMGINYSVENISLREPDSRLMIQICYLHLNRNNKKKYS